MCKGCLLKTRPPSNSGFQPVLNYVFVACGFALSVTFLVRNLYPVLSAADMRTSKMLVIAIVLLHAGLSVAIKVLFFAHGSPALEDGDGGGSPKDNAPQDGGNA